ncbi:MAG: ECF transporter S component [Ruminococcus sp.]|nr:ECF transporter S component [Ruminococcus sp.]
MFEKALTQRSVASGKKITLKALLSAGLIALAVILPQIVHIALGQPGGVQLLPMYLPVLLGGCLLGSKWALAVGVLSPVVSFAITSLMGSPMPALQRLPFMIAELAVFALVSGLFTNKIYENGLWAFPAVISAQIAGRLVFLGLVALFQSVTPFSVAMIWGQIQTGLIGLAVQAVLVPLLVIAIRALLIKDKK